MINLLKCLGRKYKAPKELWLALPATDIIDEDLTHSPGTFSGSNFGR